MAALLQRAHPVADRSVTLVLAGLSTESMQKRRRRPVDAPAGLLRKVRLDAGMSRVLRTLAPELFRLLSAERILMACRETGGESAFLWVAERIATTGRIRIGGRELEPAERGSYFFNSPAGWGARWAKRDLIDFVALDHEGTRLERGDGQALPESIAGYEACLACSFVSGDDWTGRVLVINPQFDNGVEASVRLLGSLVRTLNPAIHNTYQYQQLRVRLAEVERANLADLLHDGLLQALIAIEMRVRTLRSQLPQHTSAASSELSTIEDLLHHEIVGVRDVMQVMKPLRVRADELVDFIADQVHRHEFDSAIRIRFHVDVQRVALSTRRCTELARLIREALANVRKHSGARNVSVHLSESGGQWSLVVEDDGRGLRGSSRRPQAVQENRTLGATICFDSHDSASRYPSPAVIKKCVRSLGGAFRLRTARNGGLRLEVTFPSVPAAGREREEAFRSVGREKDPFSGASTVALVPSARHGMAWATLNDVETSHRQKH